MVVRRIVIAALLCTVLGTACGGGNNKVAANDDASVLGIQIERTTTTAAPDTTTTVAVAEDPTTTTTTVHAAAKPAVKPATPAPATIEVDYQPASGSTATATIDGPNGTHSKSLDSGAAIFGGLPAGTYQVTVTVDTPSNDPTVGAARQILNGENIDVGPGDHATVTCDDANGCTGVLSN